MKKSPQYPPPLIRELVSPAASYLHLKAVVGPNEHDHSKPTLCGLEDHGSWAYAVPETMSEVERLRQEKGAVYPLCPHCDAAYSKSQPDVPPENYNGAEVFLR